jgi:hypothetical protein
MNTIEGFRELLKNGETKKAIEMLSLTGMGGRYLQVAILYGTIEVIQFLVNVRGFNYNYYYDLYHDVVGTNDFVKVKWFLSRKINWLGLASIKGFNTPLDCSISLAIMYLLIEYGATGNKLESKLAIMRYRNHKASLRTICAIIINARNGHKDTNVIIARLVWALRLIVD